MIAALSLLGWSGSRAQAADCLAPPLVVGVAAGEESRGDCAFVDLQAAARGYLSFPEAGLSRGVTLSRARLELAARVRDVSARMAVNAVRSSGEQGYLGIDGEALVPEIRVAEARVDFAGTGLSLAAGLVDDPYLMSIQPAWGRRDLLAPMTTDQGYLDRSDVGMWLGWTSPQRYVSATAAVTTGEGYTRRERNEQVNLTGVLHVRPAPGGALEPELLVMARSGSRGLGSVPDHRAGGAVIVRHEDVIVGAELIAGWGLAGDATRNPLGFSAWARTPDALPLAAAVRADVARDERSLTDAEEVLLLAAAGPRLPWSMSAPGPLALMAGYEARRFGPDARPLAGAPALETSNTVFLVLSTTLRGSLPLRWEGLAAEERAEQTTGEAAQPPVEAP